MIGAPLHDARPFGPADLTEDQRYAVQTVIGWLDSMVASSAPERALRQRAGLLVIEDRTNNVVAIDGPRGSGKTSAMLATLAEVVSRPAARHASGAAATDAVHFVLGILDFDPIPPDLPALVWIVDAFRRELRSLRVRGAEGCPRTGGEDETTWRDLLHGVIRGWCQDAVRDRSLADLLLDRTDQADDWLDLRQNWRSAVDALVKKLEVDCPRLLSPTGMLVVPIDDVDMQIERAPELLHALRLLHHPRVAWLLTMDRNQLVDVVYRHTCRRLAPQGKRCGRDADARAHHYATAVIDKVVPRVASLRTVSLSWVAERLQRDFGAEPCPPALEAVRAFLENVPAARQPLALLRRVARIRAAVQSPGEKLSEGDWVGRILETVRPEDWSGWPVRIPAEGEGGLVTLEGGELSAGRDLDVAPSDAPPGTSLRARILPHFVWFSSSAAKPREGGPAHDVLLALVGAGWAEIRQVRVDEVVVRSTHAGLPDYPWPSRSVAGDAGASVRRLLEWQTKTYGQRSLPAEQLWRIWRDTMAKELAFDDLVEFAFPERGLGEAAIASGVMPELRSRIATTDAHNDRRFLQLLDARSERWPQDRAAMPPLGHSVRALEYEVRLPDFLPLRMYLSGPVIQFGARGGARTVADTLLGVRTARRGGGSALEPLRSLRLLLARALAEHGGDVLERRIGRLPNPGQESGALALYSLWRVATQLDGHGDLLDEVQLDAKLTHFVAPTFEHIEVDAVSDADGSGPGIRWLLRRVTDSAVLRPFTTAVGLMIQSLCAWGGADEETQARVLLTGTTRDQDSSGPRFSAWADAEYLRQELQNVDKIIASLADLPRSSVEPLRAAELLRILSEILGREKRDPFVLPIDLERLRMTRDDVRVAVTDREVPANWFDRRQQEIRDWLELNQSNLEKLVGVKEP